MRKPPRPEPTEKITDYDDGDPYSCIAAGRAELDLQASLQRKVEACYGQPDEHLQKLAQADLASVKTALYDIWDKPSHLELGRWAAQQMALLGDPSLVNYDSK